MKSSLRKLRGFAFHKHDQKEKRNARFPAYQDELLQASQDMLDMKNCYDSLLSAAAATANSAYEFSEALRELGACLLEKTALNDDEESGRVLLMLGKAQFELQKLVDSYRVHIIQTITTPSESLLKELQTVEDMKRQCDEKRDLYRSMIATQREKGTLRNTKVEHFTSEQLQTAQEDFQEETTFFVFRLKSLKQGQSRSLLTQAARHHAAQLNFFRKGVKSLEMVEPHVKVIAEQQHIDYQFIGLEDDDTDEEVDDYDVNDDGVVSFDYGQNDHGQDAVSHSRMSMERRDLLPEGETTQLYDRKILLIIKENLDRSQADHLYVNRGPRGVSMSEPLLADKKLEFSERISQMRPASTKKYHTYVLPTPLDVKSSSLASSNNTISASKIVNKGGFPTQLYHSSPLQPDMLAIDSRDVQLPSPTRFPKAHSVLKENINSGPISRPTSLHEELSMSQFALNPSDTKKIKRQAFSGPLTSQTLLNKATLSAAGSLSTVDYPSRFSAMPTHITPQLNAAQKLSLSSSPPVSSPRINELHELPRPPLSSAKPVRPSGLIGHSGPLMYRGREHNTSNKIPSISSHMASPLPTPPGAMTRSFSIPSSGQRTPSLTVEVGGSSYKSEHDHGATNLKLAICFHLLFRITGVLLFNVIVLSKYCPQA
ncbi:hypothetical protein OPV22_029140 [Ensete ventricosum]|uniref:BAR domain-containing protein n=1 Tax=Ensete ventricosum TaxID=4639 RepID=A0AAV8Q8D2_ENSVE|nr:hypothetical protein OPV22_029140 [Ensete ventricosum]